MTTELEYEETNSNGQFQLLRVDVQTVYYYADKGEAYTVFKYEDKEATELAELYVDFMVFPVEIIGDWIYCFASNDEDHGLYRINIDGSSVEKIGESYWAPNYLLE